MQQININSKYRKNYATTLSTDFIFNLPHEIKNVKSLEYISSEFTNIPFSINSRTGSNNFKFIDATTTEHEIIVPEGHYTGIQLATQITTDIANIAGLATTNKPTVEFDINSRKFRFYNASVSMQQFALDFSYKLLDMNDNVYHANFNTIDNKFLTLGWILGFRKTQYTYADDYKAGFDTVAGKYKKGITSEGVYEKMGLRYFMLMVNDYNNSHKNGIISTYQNNAMTDNNILAKIRYFIDSDYYTIDTEVAKCTMRTYNGKTDINRLHIKLMDQYGRPIDLNGMDFSLTLGCEVEN